MILLTHAQEERDIFYGPEALAGLRALGEVRLNESGKPLAGTEFIAALAGCTVAVGDSKATPDAAVFAAAPDLVAYVHNHVDIRRIDVAAASANGILVTRASAGFGPAVAELVIGFMIDLHRGITAFSEMWRKGGAPRIFLSAQLSSRTLGIIGYGHIGRHLARLVEPFAMRVLVHDPYVKIEPGGPVGQVSMDDLLASSDFVVPLAVATPETANLVNAAALARMKPTAYLINVSRGDLVDEDALEDALNRNVIAGAALDVGRAPFQMPPDRLASRPDVLATPHIGGVTPEGNRHQALDTIRQVKAVLAGEVPAGALNADHATRLRRLAGKKG
jgi:D-3-phosphoglycerate dehydrogenase